MNEFPRDVLYDTYRIRVTLLVLLCFGCVFGVRLLEPEIAFFFFWLCKNGFLLYQY